MQQIDQSRQTRICADEEILRMSDSPTTAAAVSRPPAKDTPESTSSSATSRADAQEGCASFVVALMLAGTAAAPEESTGGSIELHHWAGGSAQVASVSQMLMMWYCSTKSGLN